MAKVSFDPAIKPIARKIAQLKSDIVYSAALGNYKGFKAASKEHAKLAVENFDVARQIPAPSFKAPLFSKAGLRMAKVWFFNKFRIKTPEEKLLKQMGKQERLKQQAKKYITY